MPRHVDHDDRRGQVLDAVARLAAREGLDAVSARAVAAEAGLSLGAVTRQFPHQEHLHAEAMRAVARRVGERLARRPADDVAGRLGEVLALTDESHAEALVYYAYLARARLQPALRSVADEVDDALAALCRQAVDTLAPGLPAEVRSARAGQLHALTEGLALGLVTWPQRRRREDARALLDLWLADLSRAGAD